MFLLQADSPKKKLKVSESLKGQKRRNSIWHCTEKEEKATPGKKRRLERWNGERSDE